MNILELIKCYKSESIEMFNSISDESILKFVEIIFDLYEREGTIYACGNGGNVASVQNLVVDLNMHPFVSDDKNKSTIFRNRFKAVSLCSDQAMITGISNDLGYNFIFSEQLKYQGNENDILFGMTGSGNSSNVIEACKIAKDKKMKIVIMTRNPSGKSDQYADLVIRLSGTSKFPGQIGGNNNNFHYEDCLSKITHILVGLLKEKVKNEN